MQHTKHLMNLCDRLSKMRKQRQYVEIRCCFSSVLIFFPLSPFKFYDVPYKMVVVVFFFFEALILKFIENQQNWGSFVWLAGCLLVCLLECSWSTHFLRIFHVKSERPPKLGSHFEINFLNFPSIGYIIWASLECVCFFYSRLDVR